LCAHHRDCFHDAVSLFFLFVNIPARPAAPCLLEAYSENISERLQQRRLNILRLASLEGKARQGKKTHRRRKLCEQFLAFSCVAPVNQQFNSNVHAQTRALAAAIVGVDQGFNSRVLQR
jgi:hypothetical protein